jgi:hypothetical protein
MGDNPELERAEAELAERRRREKEPRPEAKWSDYAIFSAMVMQFLAALIWVAFFLGMLVYMLCEGRVSRLFVWRLCSLPAAIASFGIGCALDRVLDLTSPVRLRPPNGPEEEPVARA